MIDDATPLRPTARAIAFIKGFETCARPIEGQPGVFTAYKPTATDKWTIGWGSTGHDVLEHLVWPQAQCDTRFERDLSDFASGLNHLLAGSHTTQPQFDALLAFCYNVGLAALGGSTLLKLHCAGDHTGAAAEFPKWNHQGGVVLAGLTRRRMAEAAIYQEA